MTTTHNTLKPWPRLASHLAHTLERPWLSAIVRKSAVEDTLGALHPLLSLDTVKARVVHITEETPTLHSFILEPNAHWQGARSGQFVRVQTEINGRVTERAYSLSSRGGAKRLALTIKRKEGGLMSNFLHQQVRVGSVLTLSQAEGEFVLPATDPLPGKILLLSAGSGVSPVMALMRELHEQEYAGEVIFLNVCRDTSEQIWTDELSLIGDQMPGLTVVTHFTSTQGRLDAQTLLCSVPDLAERATWLCGPAAWMDQIHALWAEQGYASPLTSERFGGGPTVPADAGTPVSVACERSATHFVTEGAQPLLVQAERAGLAPKHGCRIGICRSCQCTKKSGTVENLLTGEISSAPNEEIRLCISTARSDVTLVL